MRISPSFEGSSRALRVVSKVVEIAFGDDAERADGRQRAALGAVDPVDAVALADRPTLAAARQIEVLREDVARVDAVALVNRAQIKMKAPPERVLYIDIASVGPGTVREVTSFAFEDAPDRARSVVQHGDILWSCVRPAAGPMCCF